MGCSWSRRTVLGSPIIGSRSSSSAGADAPSGDRVESGDRKVGGSGGDAGVSAVLSGDWGGVRGRGLGGGGISVFYV